jgi:hypothetical protein
MYFILKGEYYEYLKIYFFSWQIEYLALIIIIMIIKWGKMDNQQNLLVSSFIVNT